MFTCSQLSPVSTINNVYFANEGYHVIITIWILEELRGVKGISLAGIASPHEESMQLLSTCVLSAVVLDFGNHTDPIM
jgi:hypothetical protein